MPEVKNKQERSQSAEDRALERFSEMIIAKLESIKADWKKPWFSEGAMKWPRNLNGREYNGMNAFMLQLLCEEKGYDMPVFCTFDRVAGLNYTKQKDGKREPVLDADGQKLPVVSINKGAKSFPVFVTTYTVVDKDTKEKIKYEDYKQMDDELRKQYNVYPKLQVFNVFNVAQTNLKEVRPELYAKLAEQMQIVRTGNVGEGKEFAFPALDAMAKDNGWICPIKPTYGDNAYYSISRQEIVIPEKEQFEDGESYYNTMAHEMMHSTGAENQLGRIKGGASFGSLEYAREELVAEFGSALVMSRYGVERTIKNDSLPYLKSWLNSLHESPEYLKTVLLDVKRASSMVTQRIDNITQRIEQGLEPIEKPEKQVQEQEQEEQQQEQEERHFRRGR